MAIEDAPPPARATPRYTPRAPRRQLYLLPKKSLTKLLRPAVDPAGPRRTRPRGGGHPHRQPLALLEPDYHLSRPPQSLASHVHTTGPWPASKQPSDTPLESISFEWAFLSLSVIYAFNINQGSVKKHSDTSDTPSPLSKPCKKCRLRTPLHRYIDFTYFDHS